MFSIWLILVYVMADVMGHGSDGGGQDSPPPSYSDGCGHCEAEPAPRRNTRGTAKNLALYAEVKKRGGPLTLPFDDTTHTPDGKYKDYLTLEAETYIWHNISLDKGTWDDVSATEKSALHKHLSMFFDLNLDHEKRSAIDVMIKKRYKDCKNNAKKIFRDKYAALANSPNGMSTKNWQNILQHFLSEEQKKHTAANTASKQLKVANCAETSTYSSTCYKKSQSRLERFRAAHALKDGTIDRPITACQISELEAELVAMHQTQSSCSSSSTASRVAPDNEVVAFETLSGEERGTGVKPSNSSVHLQQSTPPVPMTLPMTKAQIGELFAHPLFRELLQEFLQSTTNAPNVGRSKKKKKARNDEDKEKNEEEKKTTKS